MEGIKYINTLVQVRPCHFHLFYVYPFPPVYHGLVDRCLFSILHGKQTFSVSSTPYYIDLSSILTKICCRAKWKYKLTTIILGILMFYMIIASIVCAVQASHQGGAANSVMLFSILVTYGCEYSFHTFRLVILFSLA